jgi:hypothetical protein
MVDETDVEYDLDYEPFDDPPENLSKIGQDAPPVLQSTLTPEKQQTLKELRNLAENIKSGKQRGPIAIDPVQPASATANARPSPNFDPFRDAPFPEE